jgi:dephospho-CoA kinase
VERKPQTLGKKPVVGLIGGIGSGKSTVAEELKRHGARIISGDAVGHEALQQPDIRRQIVERWGSEVLDESGKVNRRKIAQIVFKDPAELRALEGMVFPWIEKRFAEEIRAAQSAAECKLVVLDAAIMLEVGWSHVCDRIVYVHADRETRLERVAAQRGWTAAEVAERERAQLSLSEKASRADDVIENSGGREQTARQVEGLLGKWGIV